MLVLKLGVTTFVDFEEYIVRSACGKRLQKFRMVDGEGSSTIQISGSGSANSGAEDCE